MTSLRITDIQGLYAQAESAIKRYERVGLDNLVAAINELRYAGQHVLAAAASDDAEEKTKHLLRAERHCERARYDAQESTIVALLEGFATIRNLELTDSELKEVLPDWQEMLGRASHAQKYLAQAGNVKNVAPEELDGAIADLMNAHEKLCAVEPLIMGLRQKKIGAIDAARQAEEDRRVAAEEMRQNAQRTEEDRRYVRSIMLAWIGLVVGLLGFAASVFGIILAMKDL